MKKAGLYFLIILMATCNTGAGELLKLPAFFNHYAEHNHKPGGLSFSAFIEMHYFGKDADDHDEKKDAALPFKNYHYNTHYSPAFFAVTENTAASFTASLYTKAIPSRPDLLPQNAYIYLFRPPCG